LPIYPLIFIFVSRLIDFFLYHRRRGYFAGLLLGLWYLIATVSIYPDYLAYFNELVGGPAQGYKYLDDSNLEWGQDLKRLKIYLDQHNISKIKLLYSWNASPDYYGIQWERLSKEDWQEKPSPGIYALNTHALIRGEFFAKTQGVHTDWLSRYKPIDRVGYSFYIFKFD
jgi:type I restriction-modification system DNA methylase subunit